MPITFDERITTEEAKLVAKILDCTIVDKGDGNLVITPLATKRVIESGDVIPFRRQAE